MYPLQDNKLIKLILELALILCYFIYNGSNYTPNSLLFILMIGFTASYKTRTKKIDYIDKVIFLLIFLIIIVSVIPSINYFGLLRNYIKPFSNIISLVIYLFGTNIGYLFTKRD